MADQFATFAQLDAKGSTAIYTCMAPGFHCTPVVRFSGAEGVERWGSDTTIEDVRRRLRCRCCGHRGPRIVMEVFTPGGPDGGFSSRNGSRATS